MNFSLPRLFRGVFVGLDYTSVAWDEGLEPKEWIELKVFLI